MFKHLKKYGNNEQTNEFEDRSIPNPNNRNRERVMRINKVSGICNRISSIITLSSLRKRLEKGEGKYFNK